VEREGVEAAVGKPGVFAARVSYDGDGFAGFQRQPGLRTVQGRIEDALAIILRRGVVTTGAGRTDTGVHARAQVMSFVAEGGEPPIQTLQRSLNALCAPDIAVTDLRMLSPGFDARHSAIEREYRFRLVTGAVPPVFLRRYAWWVRGSLDLDSMRAASTVLLGEHDFASFCVTESAKGKNTRRGIDTLEIEPATHLGEACIEIRVVGRAFLHSMVRIVVGSLVEVGKGRRSPEWLGQALAACDRAAAGPTAPPHGLVLWDVRYPEEWGLHVQ